MKRKEEIERKKLPTLNTRKQDNAQNLIMHLYKAPVVSIKNIRNVLNVQTNTASSLVKDFTQLGILKELTGRKRNRLFIFEEYFQIFVNK